MFRSVRALIEVIESLDSTLKALVEATLQAGPAADRLEILELSHAQWEAEMQALLLKADSKMKSANNAEARERTMKKSYEKYVDPFDQEGAPELAPVPGGDVEGGEEEGVPPVYPGVAPLSAKEMALRHKFAS